LTKEQMITELEATIREMGSPKDNANRGDGDKALVGLQAMSLLAELKGWKEVKFTGKIGVKERIDLTALPF